MSRNLTAVIKATKLCNMRCTYCYEFDHLANPARMSQNQLSTLFGVLAEIEDSLGAEMKFCWHGGEPTLLGPDYYAEARREQVSVFGADRRHLVQTNLFSLSQRTQETLAQFDDVSISFDVRGAERQTIRGGQTRDKVAANMDLLRTSGIRFGAINVLNRQNYDGLDDIFSFYNQAGISFRLLPYYREANAATTDIHGLAASEVRDAMLSLVDLWFAQSRGSDISPIGEFVRIALLHVSDAPHQYVFDKAQREHVLLIDTNGDVYTAGTAYSPTHKYGNVFEDTAAAILHSEGRARAVERSQRLQRVCNECPYLGHCPGYTVAEQTDVELRSNDTGFGCPVVRPCVDRAVEWIRSVEPGVHPRGDGMELGEVT